MCGYLSPFPSLVKIVCVCMWQKEEIVSHTLAIKEVISRRTGQEEDGGKRADRNEKCVCLSFLFKRSVSLNNRHCDQRRETHRHLLFFVSHLFF